MLWIRRELLGDSESVNGSKPKGVRGKKAPLTAKLMRVPLPLANQVNQLIESYLGYLCTGGNVAEPPLLLGELKLINSLNKSVNSYTSLTYPTRASLHLPEGAQVVPPTIQFFTFSQARQIVPNPKTAI